MNRLLLSLSAGRQSPAPSPPFACFSKQWLPRRTVYASQRYRQLSQVPTSPPAPSHELQKIAKDVWLIEGDALANAKGEQPDVVVLFGWMDAKINHIQKYSSGYRNVFPASNLLLVQSHSNFFWTRHTANVAALQPAAAYLDSRGITSSEGRHGTPKLLLHAFSNGGAAQMNTLGELLRDRNTDAKAESLTRHTLPAQAIIVDSAPGGEALKGLITAFSLPLPQWRRPLRAISVTFFWSILKLYKAVVQPKPMFVEKIRAQLLDSSILPKDAKRLYIYSKTDTIIMQDDTESHIEDARAAKLDVTTEVYDKSPHVSHVRTDGPRYWKAVEDVWKRSV